MNKTPYTYSIRSISLYALLGEAVFWVLAALILLGIGYFDVPNDQHIQFKQPDAFWLLLGLPLLYASFYKALRATNQLANATSKSIQKTTLTPVSSLRTFIRFFLFRSALVCLIIALAQPVYGTKKVSATIETLELVIALDISNSMNTKDISSEASRLDVAKRALNDLINNLHGERIGVTVFAGSAFVQLPLTSDYSSAKLFVNEIETSMLSDQGTNISAALEVATTMFSPQKTTKGIVLVTDGENHEGIENNVLSALNDKKIQVCILGLGTALGGPIPIDANRPELGYKASPDGKTITSKVNPTFIKDIAQKTNAYATISSSPFPDIRQLLTQINKMQRMKVRDLSLEVRDNRFQLPLLLALFLLLIYFIVPIRSIK